MKTIPKSWAKTNEEIGGIWDDIEVHAFNCEKASKREDLDETKESAQEVIRLIKQIERAKVAKIIEK